MERICNVAIRNLQSMELMHVRNTLDFLQRVLNVFVPKSGCVKMIIPFLEYLMMVSLYGRR